MREFFKGWRRKVGCVTLVMACAVATAWVRSELNYLDDYFFTLGMRDHNIMSGYGRMTWWSWDGEAGNRSRPVFAISPYETERVQERGMALQRCYPDRNFKEVTVPYSLIVLPPTLLSAYLLLWKPRTKPKPAAGSVTNA